VVRDEFCLLNNIAIAAEYNSIPSCEKVAHNLDLHHENGTQGYFGQMTYFMYQHQSPFYQELVQ
jgi:acetoin utilization deacetylase AcuC-like enzyme